MKPINLTDTHNTISAGNPAFRHLQDTTPEAALRFIRAGEAVGRFLKSKTRSSETPTHGAPQPA